MPTDLLQIQKNEEKIEAAINPRNINAKQEKAFNDFLETIKATQETETKNLEKLKTINSYTVSPENFEIGTASDTIDTKTITRMVTLRETSETTGPSVNDQPLNFNIDGKFVDKDGNPVDKQTISINGIIYEATFDTEKPTIINIVKSPDQSIPLRSTTRATETTEKSEKKTTIKETETEKKSYRKETFDIFNKGKKPDQAQEILNVTLKKAFPEAINTTPEVPTTSETILGFIKTTMISNFEDIDNKQLKESPSLQNFIDAKDAFKNDITDFKTKINKDVDVKITKVIKDIEDLIELKQEEEKFKRTANYFKTADRTQSKLEALQKKLTTFKGEKIENTETKENKNKIDPQNEMSKAIEAQITVLTTKEADTKEINKQKVINYFDNIKDKDAAVNVMENKEGDFNDAFDSIFTEIVKEQNKSKAEGEKNKNNGPITIKIEELTDEKIKTDTTKFINLLKMYNNGKDLNNIKIGYADIGPTDQQIGKDYPKNTRIIEYTQDKISEEALNQPIAKGENKAVAGITFSNTDGKLTTQKDNDTYTYNTTTSKFEKDTDKKTTLDPKTLFGEDNVTGPDITKNETDGSFTITGTKTETTQESKVIVRGTMDHMQSLRAEKSMGGERNEKGEITKQPDFTNGVPEEFKSLVPRRPEKGINLFDNKGNYAAFKSFIETETKTDKNYVLTNLQPILNQIKDYKPTTETKDDKDYKETKFSELKNKYATVITDFIVNNANNENGSALMEAYITYLSPDNVDCLGMDKTTRSANFDKLAGSAKFQSTLQKMHTDRENSANKETTTDPTVKILNLKSTIVSQEKTTLKDKLSGAIDDILKQFGSSLFEVLKFLGLGKGSLKNMFPQLSEKIDGLYKKEYGLSEDQINAVNKISKSKTFDDVGDLTKEESKNSTSLKNKFEVRIDDYVDKFFNKETNYCKNLNPKLIQSAISAYNEKYPNKALVSTDFVNLNSKGELTITDKEYDSDHTKDFKAVLTMLITNDNTWIKIAKASTDINTPINKDKAELNNISENGITIDAQGYGYEIYSEQDIARYLSVYLFAGDKDLSYTMTENEFKNDKERGKDKAETWRAKFDAPLINDAGNKTNTIIKEGDELTSIVDERGYTIKKTGSELKILNHDTDNYIKVTGKNSEGEIFTGRVIKTSVSKETPKDAAETTGGLDIINSTYLDKDGTTVKDCNEPNGKYLHEIINYDPKITKTHPLKLKLTHIINGKEQSDIIVRGKNERLNHNKPGTYLYPGNSDYNKMIRMEAAAHTSDKITIPTDEEVTSYEKEKNVDLAKRKETPTTADKGS